MTLSIRTKLFLLSALGVVLVLALGAASRRSAVQMGDAMAEIRVTGAAIRNHLEGDMMHDALRADVLAALLARGAEIDQVRTDVEEHANHFREMIGENAALPLAPAVRDALADAKPALDAYIEHAEKIVEIAVADPEAARAEYPAFLESFETLEKRMSDLSDLVEKSGGEAEALGQRVQGSAARTTLVVCGLALLALGAGAIWVTGGIVGPLARTVRVLEQVADGDLTPRLAVDTRDEIARMAESLNHTLDAVCVLMERVNQSASSLRAGSAELTEVSEQLHGSAGHTSTQSQAASASAAEINASIQRVASAATQLTTRIDEISRDAGEVATMTARGVEAAASTDAAMVRLEQSSQEIGQTIRSIRGIADQTNALAVNAGSQAEKVAEAGAGFAVVAQEVKGLALETTQATQEIGRRLDAIRASSSDAANSYAQIGGVVKMINALAGQTKLLALNATIEASRAAAAGTGVGDMASEVKILAGETGKATAGVSQRADEIQRDSASAVEAVRQITEVVRRVSELQGAIASAVQKQSETTQEISQSVAQVAEGSGRIATSVDEVAKAADDTARGADRTRDAAARMSTTASELTELIARYRFERNAS